MATTTPNFGWAVPTSTDLVKDGAVAIETLGDAIDASLVDLKGGTTGQVLAKASGTDMDFSWVAQDDSNAIQNALLTTTGDTIYASGASTPARLGIGSTGQVLTVAGGVPSWATPATATSKVVQIIYGSTATGAGSATTTFADTNLSATITPTSASNKILVMFNQNGCHKYNANTRLQIRLVRGSTTILNSESFAGNNDGSGGNAFGSSSAVYLDSPATTSATTYKTQFANQAGAGTVYVNDQTSPGSTSTMVLMEVTP